MPTTFDRVCNLLNHARAEVTWVCRPVYRYVPADRLDLSGYETRAECERYCGGKARRVLRIQRIARIVVVYPIDGAGRLRCAVTDWGLSAQGEASHYYGSASGYGYDKLTAALQGATIGGIEIGDHSDYRGRATLRDLCRSKGWEIIGGDL